MTFENLNVERLSDQDLAELHQRTLAAAKARERGPQLEDIKPGMKPEEIKRVRDQIASVLAGLK